MAPTFTLARLTTSPSLARRYVRDAAPGGLGPDRVEDLALLVSELVTNALVHTDTGRVRLRMSTAEQSVRVEVENEAEPWVDGPELRGVALDEVGGWGLFLVERLCDRWGLEDDDRTVWAEMDLVGASRGLDETPRRAIEAGSDSHGRDRWRN